MAFKTFVDGYVLDAADLNDYLMKQTVIVCTSATRPSSPNEGMTIVETDTDRMLVYDGAAWQKFRHYAAGGRTGFRLRRVAVQSVGSGGSPTDISWDTEDTDSDGFITAHATTGTTVTIPTGLGGIYRFGGVLKIAATSTPFVGSASNAVLATVVRSGVTMYFKAAVQNSTCYDDGSAMWCPFPAIPPLDLSAADTIKISVRHDASGSKDVTGWFWGFREMI